MKKVVTILIAMAFAVGVSAGAYALGSDGEWTVDLLFKAQKAGSEDLKEDLLPVELGIKKTGDAEETLKPPPLPGYSVTEETDDAYINAYAVMSPTRGAARRVDIDEQSEDSGVWVIEVEAELPEGMASRKVSLEADFTDYDYSLLTVVVPGEDEPIKEFSKSVTEQELFTTTDGKSRKVFVMAGKARSFAAALPDEDKIVGAFGYAERQSWAPYSTFDGTEVKLKTKSGCADSGSGTITDGIFTIDGVTDDDTYLVQAKVTGYLGVECEINVSGTEATTTACDPFYWGDFHPDGVIDPSDLMQLKPSFFKDDSDPCWASLEDAGCDPSSYLPPIKNPHSTFDVNRDLVVDPSDLAQLKPGFYSEENFTCDAD